jgi:hypothetical protein
MGQSILVFVSHSSEDKIDLIEPIVADLENCYINIWLDKRKIVPGDNLRKSIFRDGLDKADVALIFFTEKSLKSSWVDREIKHVLREETKKGNSFDLNKIISIFDSEETYKQISERYPELTDDLLHLMPKDYNKIQLGQLISAIWSKYLSLQGGDIETQRQLLAKDKELFQKDKEIQDLKFKIEDARSKNSKTSLYEEFESLKESGHIDKFISDGKLLLSAGLLQKGSIGDVPQAMAFGLIESAPSNVNLARLTDKGTDFFKWLFLKQ